VGLIATLPVVGAFPGCCGAAEAVPWAGAEGVAVIDMAGSTAVDGVQKMGELF